MVHQAAVLKGYRLGALALGKMLAALSPGTDAAGDEGAKGAGLCG